MRMVETKFVVCHKLTGEHWYLFVYEDYRRAVLAAGIAAADTRPEFDEFGWQAFNQTTAYICRKAGVEFDDVNLRDWLDAFEPQPKTGIRAILRGVWDRVVRFADCLHVYGNTASTMHWKER